MNDNSISKIKRSSDIVSSVMRSIGITSLMARVQQKINNIHNIFVQKPTASSFYEELELKYQERSMNGGLAGNKAEPPIQEPKKPIPQPEYMTEVKKLVPMLVINNVGRSVDTSENSLEISLQNIGYKTLDKMKDAQSIEDLINCIRKDFVDEIRKVETRISTQERNKLILIGEGGIKVTINMREDMLSEYKYIKDDLAAHCNFVPSAGGRIKNAYANHIGYKLPYYNTIQIVFDLDVTGPTNIYDTPFLNTDPYHKLLGKSLTPMTEALLRKLEEINTETRNMYVDPLTGLLNRTSYMEARGFLKDSGVSFTEYFIEIIEDNLPSAILGYYGNEAILKTVADKVKMVDDDMAFLFEDDDSKFIVFLDITNSLEIEKKFINIKAKLSVLVPSIPIPIENVILTKRTPDGKVQLY